MRFWLESPELIWRLVVSPSGLDGIFVEPGGALLKDGACEQILRTLQHPIKADSPNPWPRPGFREPDRCWELHNKDAARVFCPTKAN